MKAPLLVVLSVLSLFSTGCEGPISIDTHGEMVAAKIGVHVDQLKFVSEGDVARAEDLEEGYTKKTKGVLAMTESHIYWAQGGIETIALEDMEIVPIAQIDEAALDYDLVQFRVSGELMVFRPHAWNRFEGDTERSIELLSLLSKNDVAMFVVTRSYRDPADFHSSLGTGLYGEASAAAAIGQSQMEAADAAWSLVAGKEGVPVTPPSERMSIQGPDY
jgi:hypothetical protein